MQNCESCKIRLRGARFVLYDCLGNAVACGVTDERGELCFRNLPLGKYYVQEVESPCGYEKCSDCKEVNISHSACNEKLEFVNSRVTGSIKVIKYGIDR